MDVGVLLPPCALRAVGGAGAHLASSSQPEVPDLMEVGDEPFIEPSFGAVACTSGGGVCLLVRSSTLLSTVVGEF